MVDNIQSSKHILFGALNSSWTNKAKCAGPFFLLVLHFISFFLFLKKHFKPLLLPFCLSLSVVFVTATSQEAWLLLVTLVLWLVHLLSINCSLTL